MPARSPRAWGMRSPWSIDGGPIHGGPASTVVDCTWDLPVIRREGAIPAALIVQTLEAAGLPHAIEL